MIALISIFVAFILSVTLNIFQELKLEKKDKQLNELKDMHEKQKEHIFNITGNQDLY